MAINGCGGRCGMGDLGSMALVQLLGGLSAFGDLGFVEHQAYDLGNLSEGYPLGDVEIAGEDYSGGDSYGGDYSQQYDDYTPAQAPDNSDLPYSTDMPPQGAADQAALADIIAQRRQAIADAMKQRDVQQAKVADLDHQIVDILNPQYQQALQSGDQEAAVKIGGQIRILNFQRAEAVQKALDWAAFQATASQMTKNAYAQMQLQQLYYQTMQQDPSTAQAIAQVYQEIGQATMAVKAARAAQIQQKKMEDQQYRQSLIQSQSDRVTAAQNDITTKKAALVAAQKAYTRASAVGASGRTTAAAGPARKKVETAAGDYNAAVQTLKQQQQILQSLTTQASSLPAPTVAEGIAPQSLPDAGLEGLDDVAPYCTVYTRDGYGPTCAQASIINLGANLGWDEPAMPYVAQGVRGIARSLGELGSWWDVAEKLTVVGATGVAEQMKADEATRKAKAQSDLFQAACESDCRGSKENQGNSSLMQACLIRCRAGVSSASLVKSPVLPMPAKQGLFERPGVVLALAVVGGGVLAGLYMAAKKPAGATQVSGLHSRRRRRSHRRRR
jgi:hypothetical protein